MASAPPASLDSRLAARPPEALQPGAARPAPAGPWRSLRALLPGLLLTGALAAAALQLATLPWLAAHGISALTLAIVLGIVAGNVFYGRVAPSCGAGVAFSKQRLLRLGIVLYGLRLTFQDIGQVGVAGVVIDALVLCSTFALALVAGHPPVQAGPHHRAADRRGQLDLRRRRGHGDRAGGARARRAGGRRGVDRGDLRHPLDVPLPGALPGADAGRLGWPFRPPPMGSLPAPPCTRWRRWWPRAPR